MTLTLLLAAGALLAALVALAVALLAWRKGDDALTHAHSHPKPQPDRRSVELGPPRSTGERRGGAHSAEGRARRRDADDPGWTTRDPEQTDAMPRVELPTTAMRAQAGPVRLPPPGAIGRR